MTDKEKNKFYQLDKKKYILEKNKVFLNWFKISIKNGYSCYMDVTQLQDLIDTITNWYEIKYPEKDLEQTENILYLGISNHQKMSDLMTFNHLLYKLDNNQSNLIEASYNGQELIDFIKECNITEMNDFSLEKYIDKDDIKFTKLKKSLYNYICNIKLRDMILQLVALKLLFSRKTTPQRGYERAKIFINEFNDNLNLSLSTEEVDNIVDKFNLKDKLINDKKSILNNNNNIKMRSKKEK